MKFHAQARKNMVDCQIHTSGVSHAEVLDVFERTPRELFVPQAYQDVAYLGEDLVMGRGRFLLEPAVHARMVEALALDSESYVLDLSVSNGYSAAILGPLAGTVLSLDSQKSGLDKAQSAWQELGVTNAVGFQGTLAQGWGDDAPYTHIFLGGAVAEVPEDLVAQLKPGGTMVLILKAQGQTFGTASLLQRVEVEGDTDAGVLYSVISLFECASPYLPGFEPRDSFSF